MQAAADVECRTADGKSLIGCGLEADVATASVRAILSGTNGAPRTIDLLANMHPNSGRRILFVIFPIIVECADSKVEIAIAPVVSLHRIKVVLSKIPSVETSNVETFDGGIVKLNSIMLKMGIKPIFIIWLSNFGKGR